MKNTEITNDFVIHYGGALHSVEANTFANSLVAIARVFEETNYLLNPAYKIEIRVEALAEGSFRPKVRLFTKNLVSKISPFMPEKNTLVPVVLALFALHPSGSGNTIIINADNVVMQNGKSKIVIPKEAYESAKKISNNKVIKSAISQNFSILDEDSSITSFGFTPNEKSDDYLFFEDSVNFKEYCKFDSEEDKLTKTVDLSAELKLLKIILEKGNRKWEFVWNGIKISAPITDSVFWEDLRIGNIQISQGDSIDVILRIYQKKDPYADVFLNEKYEITEVKKYNKTLKQKDDLFDKP